MSKTLIVHPREDGGVLITTPTGVLDLHEVARKDVPFGRPFIFVNESEIPSDRTFRAAWEADFSVPDGYGIGAQRWFIEQAEAELLNVVSREAPAPAAITVAVSQEDVVFPVDTTAEQQAALYQAYLAEVAQENERIAARNQSALAAFEAQKQTDTDRCNALIAQMKAEVLAIEGVQL